MASAKIGIKEGIGKEQPAVKIGLGCNGTACLNPSEICTLSLFFQGCGFGLFCFFFLSVEAVRIFL